MRFRRDPYLFDLELPPGDKNLARATKAALRGVPQSALRRLRPAMTYTLIVSKVSPAAIHKLNRQYRQKDRPTDVLSFSRLDGFPPELGDVILSPTIAKRQAKELGIPADEEVMRITVHGILHLFGYDHETNESDAKRMFRLQNKILATLGITPESPRSDRASRPSKRGKAWRYI